MEMNRGSSQGRATAPTQATHVTPLNGTSYSQASAVEYSQPEHFFKGTVLVVIRFLSYFFLLKIVMVSGTMSENFIKFYNISIFKNISWDE